MNHHTDWSDDELEDREDPDEDDRDDDELEIIECPECGRQVYEELEQCPHCGQYITHDTRVWTGKPWWWTLLALAGIAAVLWTLMAFG